ncbi:MAG: hypothetical protein HKN20_08580 [Gemmatimonadetes bacterium]|nr:hypothetical protein [Gemmatimonadota bacterium]
MSTLFILGVGVFVTGIAATAVVFIGLSEAADPNHSRREDLTEWEWSQIRELRKQNQDDGAE